MFSSRFLVPLVLHHLIIATLTFALDFRSQHTRASPQPSKNVQVKQKVTALSKKTNSTALNSSKSSYKTVDKLKFDKSIISTNGNINATITKLNSGTVTSTETSDSDVRLVHSQSVSTKTHPPVQVLSSLNQTLNQQQTKRSSTYPRATCPKDKLPWRQDDQKRLDNLAHLDKGSHYVLCQGEFGRGSTTEDLDNGAISLTPIGKMECSLPMSLRGLCCFDFDRLGLGGRLQTDYSEDEGKSIMPMTATLILPLEHDTTMLNREGDAELDSSYKEKVKETGIILCRSTYHESANGEVRTTVGSAAVDLPANPNEAYPMECMKHLFLPREGGKYRPEAKYKYGHGYYTGNGDQYPTAADGSSYNYNTIPVNNYKDTWDAPNDEDNQILLLQALAFSQNAANTTDGKPGWLHDAESIGTARDATDNDALWTANDFGWTDQESLRQTCKEGTDDGTAAEAFINDASATDPLHILNEASGFSKTDSPVEFMHGWLKIDSTEMGTNLAAAAGGGR